MPKKKPLTLTLKVCPIDVAASQVSPSQPASQPFTQSTTSTSSTSSASNRSPDLRISESSMTGRRQYQSCDYCRHRRRKCDAAALGINRLFTDDNLDFHPGVTACRNCAKAGRSCSFLWLIGRKQSRLNAVNEKAARQSHHSWSEEPTSWRWCR